MQLMYSTAKDIAKRINIDLNEENILEPDININLGTKYISMLIQKYDNINLALAAYNAGPRKCKQMDRRPEVCKKMAQI